MTHPKGFTLLEVLLALAIFSLIALTTSHQINVIRNTKDSALGQIEQFDAIRSAVAIMRQDLQQAFHKRRIDLGQEIQSELARGAPAPHTLFDGRKNQLIFTSLSHRNYYATRPDGQQAEVSYFLEDTGNNRSALLKRESSMIDSEPFSGGQIFRILEDVTQLEFEFWDEKLSKWTSDWNSDAGITKDLFPLAIKMKLATWDKKLNREVTLETSFKLSFPNNSDQWVAL